MGRGIALDSEALFADTVHEFAHSLPDAGLSFYLAHLRMGRHAKFAYTEQYSVEAGRGPVDWSGMAKEYCSELARVLLTEVEVPPGVRFEEAATQHLVRSYAGGDRSFAGSLREIVHHFMRSVAPIDYPWEQQVPQIRRGVRRLAATFNPHRFRRMYVERVQDAELRSGLDRVAMMLRNQVPSARLETFVQGPALEEAMRTYDAAIEREICSARAYARARHDPAYLRLVEAWTSLSEEAAYFNSDLHTAKPPRRRRVPRKTS